MNLSSMAALYQDALSATREEEPGSVREPDLPRAPKLPDEQTLQLLLAEGVFGTIFTDDLGRSIQILDFGDWNKSAGPDFLNAQIRINDLLQTGDIELDPIPEDWERHGHGANPAFNKVILHLACVPSKREWFTRNSKHEHIPLAIIPQESLVLANTTPSENKPIRHCRHSEYLSTVSLSVLEMLLQTAAAYRFQNKHRRYKTRVQYAGEEQTLFESFAETLGYHANKTTMRHLAMRAPLQAIRHCPEAILFGTAGFLIPILPTICTPEAVAHHKKLWEQWWPIREQFELAPERTFPWVFSGNRPANHPQRRVGALAVIAEDFSTFKKICLSGRIKELTDYLTSLFHPYWSTHVTLPSAPSKRPMALVGKERILAFVVNHLFPSKGNEATWQQYLSLKAGQAGTKVFSVYQSLIGNRKDAKEFLTKAWHHQALLQIHEDLCSLHSCSICSLIKQIEKR